MQITWNDHNILSSLQIIINQNGRHEQANLGLLVASIKF